MLNSNPKAIDVTSHIEHIKQVIPMEKYKMPWALYTFDLRADATLSILSVSHGAMQLCTHI